MARNLNVFNRGERVENAVVVFINKKILHGWKTIEISKSLSTLSGTFNLEIADKYKAEDKVWDFQPGAPVVIQIGSEKIIDGFIDTVDVSNSTSERSFSFAGRDKTADVIDCGVTAEPGEFKNIKLEDLAKTLVKDFGLSVVADQDTGAVFAKVTVSPGETAFEVIDKHAKMRGFLVTTDEDSRIIFRRPSTTRNKTAIIQGKNLKSVSATYDNSARFSSYIVKGQAQGTDDVFGVNASQIKGTASDAGIKRTRPMVIIAEKSINAEQAKTRAQWEASVRVAKSLKVTASIYGWHDQAGQLWRPNQLVRIQSVAIGLDEILLVEDVSLSKNSEGTVASLGLTRPDAYKPEPTKPDTKELSGGIFSIAK